MSFHSLEKLLSTGETTLGELFSVLDTPLQDRRGHTGAGPVNGHKDDTGTAASDTEVRLRELALISLEKPPSQGQS